MDPDSGRTGLVTSLLRGIAAGLVAGVVWWAIELAVNREAGGDVPWSIAQQFLAVDLVGGLIGGILVGLVLGGLGYATAAPLAMGLSVVYGFCRVLAPPGYLAEAAYLVCGTLGAVFAVVVAGAGRDGILGFVHLLVLTTASTLVGAAVIGGIQSTYFAFSEPSGWKQIALLVGLPLGGVVIDRVVGFVVRSRRLRSGLGLRAPGAGAFALGRPMATTPIDDTLVTAPPPPAGTPDVILVSMDTTRADHMSTYGYARETSPNLTALAHDALNFPHAISPAQWTVPGHASMLTGLYPNRHGAHYSGEHGGPKIQGRSRVFPLGPEQITLAEILRDRGYSTGGFVANFANLDRSFGFAQGFEHYEDLPGLLLRPLPPVVRLVQQFVPYFAKKPFRSAH